MVHVQSFALSKTDRKTCNNVLLLVSKNCEYCSACGLYKYSTSCIAQSLGKERHWSVKEEPMIAAATEILFNVVINLEGHVEEYSIVGGNSE